MHQDYNFCFIWKALPQLGQLITVDYCLVDVNGVFFFFFFFKAKYLSYQIRVSLTSTLNGLFLYLELSRGTIYPTSKLLILAGLI